MGDTARRGDNVERDFQAQCLLLGKEPSSTFLHLKKLSQECFWST